jgi:hypothetical protein
LQVAEVEELKAEKVAEAEQVVLELAPYQFLHKIIQLLLEQVV